MGRTSAGESSSLIAPDPRAGSGGDRSRRPSIRRRMSVNMCDEEPNVGITDIESTILHSFAVLTRQTGERRDQLFEVKEVPLLYTRE
jgi:hypothetical protein